MWTDMTKLIGAFQHLFVVNMPKTDYDYTQINIHKCINENENSGWANAFTSQ
jgi:UDP-galactopyranose mutase